MGYNVHMEYLNEIEETVFEPEFGYGYEPGAKKKRKKQQEAGEERFRGMKKPLANPLLPLLVSLLFAILLLVCVILDSISEKPGMTARVTLPAAESLLFCDV